MFKTFVVSALSCKTRLLRNYPKKLFTHRTLYTAESLGLTAFQERRNNVSKIFRKKDEFKENMQKYCEMDSEYLVFSDDIKTMIYISETDDDLVILKKMLEKLNSQNHSIIFKNFNFGPEVMRLYHYLKKPLAALDLLNDEKMVWLFKHLMSYILLSDLCFNNEMYKDVVTVFETFCEKQILSRKFPTSLNIYFLAACCKLNSKDFNEKALNFWQNHQTDFYKLTMREIQFYSYIAYNMNEIPLAIEFLSMINRKGIASNIKIMTYTQAKQYERALDVLSEILLADTPEFDNKNFILNDTIQLLKSQLEDPEHLKKLEKFINELNFHNFIKFEPLDHYLYEKVEYKKNLQYKQDNSNKFQNRKQFMY